MIFATKKEACCNERLPTTSTNLLKHDLLVSNNAALFAFFNFLFVFSLYSMFLLNGVVNFKLSLSVVVSI